MISVRTFSIWLLIPLLYFLSASVIQAADTTALQNRILGAALKHSASKSIIPDPACSYTSFDGPQYRLFPWVGKNVAVLTSSDKLSPTTMSRLISGIDKAYDYYSAVTGRRPEGGTKYKGRLSIAEVSSTCGGKGAGCGFEGINGIELMSDSFGVLYDQLNINGEFDQVVFYELGRNFWFYGPQLGKIGAHPPDASPFSTGFAILNRFLSMAAAGLKGAPFTPDMSFADFKRSILTDLLGLYLADKQLSWKNTLKINTAPPNPNNWGDADLAAAMLNVINVDAGPGGLRTFWRRLAALPAAETDIAAMENLLRAGKAATGRDYRDLFRDDSLKRP